MTAALFISLLFVCVLILSALWLKRDVTTIFKIPLLTFSLDARGKTARKKPTRRRKPPL